jgi:hypothetical protein
VASWTVVRGQFVGVQKDALTYRNRESHMSSPAAHGAGLNIRFGKRELFLIWQRSHNHTQGYLDSSASLRSREGHGHEVSFCRKEAMALVNIVETFIAARAVKPYSLILFLAISGSSVLLVGKPDKSDSSEPTAMLILRLLWSLRPFLMESSTTTPFPSNLSCLHDRFRPTPQLPLSTRMQQVV